MTSQPFLSDPMTVRPEWIDHNGHLNMAYYSVLFDHGVDQAWQVLGLGPDYLTASGMTTYLAEFHIRYVRELHVGDAVRASYQILDWNGKSIHSFQALHHVDGWLAAESESLHLSVDQGSDPSAPSVAPFPEPQSGRIAAMAEAHARLPRPDGAGRTVGIRRKNAG